jgi:hypothetical protein
MQHVFAKGGENLYRIKATVKVPPDQSDAVAGKLKGFGIVGIEKRIVPFGEFVSESRLYWDCVFEGMFEGGRDAAYLEFYFEDSQEGRAQAYSLELNLQQIPLNLAYVAG